MGHANDMITHFGVVDICRENFHWTDSIFCHTFLSSVSHCFYIPIYCMSLSEVISVFFRKAVCCNKTVIHWLVLKHYTLQRMVFEDSVITSVASTSAFVYAWHYFVPIPMLWKQATSHFYVIGLALFVWGWWMFFSEQRQVLLLSMQPISVKARGHRYISALQLDILIQTSIQKQPRLVFGGFYNRETFEDILNRTFLLQPWHPFYSTVWATTATSTSSKYLGNSSFEQVLLLVQNPVQLFLVIYCEYLLRIHLHTLSIY